MPESSLALAYQDLTSDVGSFLGFGRGTSPDPAWTDFQSERINSIVKSGLRQFYFPSVLPNETSVYDWSFLRPVTTLAFANGASTVRLPDDFGGIEGVVTVNPTSQQRTPWYLRIGLESAVREQYARVPNSSGPPQMIAIQPLRGVTDKRSSREQLFIWPLADRDYELEVAYYLIPEALNGTLPYAYGGAQHAETLLESCLAIAEQRLDDTIGVHSMKFMDRLAASVAADRKHKSQIAGGYNADRSDMLAARWPRTMHGWNYGGRTYSGLGPPPG